MLIFLLSTSTLRYNLIILTTDSIECEGERVRVLQELAVSVITALFQHVWEISG